MYQNAELNFTVHLFFKNKGIKKPPGGGFLGFVYGKRMSLLLSIAFGLFR